MKVEERQTFDADGLLCLLISKWYLNLWINIFSLVANPGSLPEVQRVKLTISEGHIGVRVKYHLNCLLPIYWIFFCFVQVEKLTLVPQLTGNYLFFVIEKTCCMDTKHHISIHNYVARLGLKQQNVQQNFTPEAATIEQVGGNWRSQCYESTVDPVDFILTASWIFTVTRCFNSVRWSNNKSRFGSETMINNVGVLAVHFLCHTEFSVFLSTHTPILWDAVGIGKRVWFHSFATRSSCNPSCGLSRDPSRCLSRFPNLCLRNAFSVRG